MTMVIFGLIVNSFFWADRGWVVEALPRFERDRFPDCAVQRWFLETSRQGRIFRRIRPWSMAHTADPGSIPRRSLTAHRSFCLPLVEVHCYAAVPTAAQLGQGSPSSFE